MMVDGGKVDQMLYLNNNLKGADPVKYTKARRGRTFILKLEDGDRIPEVIEKFAEAEEINSALVFFLGGVDETSRVVVGPEDREEQNEIIPQIKDLPRISEAVGLGTIFSSEQNSPRLHLHSAFGSQNETITGCTREGVSIWLIAEIIVLELVNHEAHRKIDPATGFELLDI